MYVLGGIPNVEYLTSNTQRQIQRLVFSVIEFYDTFKYSG